MSQNAPIDFKTMATGPGCLVRLLWYLFIGWWLSGIFIAIGWALMVSVIGAPIGLWFLHRVPWAQTLRPRNETISWTYDDSGAVTITRAQPAQVPLLIRVVYVILIGWWLGAIWLAIAWALGLLIVTLPISILMIDRSPAMVSLQRN
ncbi:hypothetical protein BH23CHL4_BH23CHL4_30650 [soil metagenome]